MQGTGKDLEESARICQNLPGCIRIFMNLQESAMICKNLIKNMIEYARPWNNRQESARIYKNLQGFARI